MSDTVIGIYLIVTLGLATVIMLHAALRHRRIVSDLIWWAFIGTFVSSVGGFLLLGTFTPDLTQYNNAASQIYNAFAWGGIEAPGYGEILEQINTMGAVITAMGLGILVMALLSGFFPRTFQAPFTKRSQTN